MNNQAVDLRYAAKAEFVALEKEVHQLTTEVKKLAINVSDFVNHSTENMDTLVAALAGKIPEGTVPLSTYINTIKWIIAAFTTILVVAIGAVKVAPLFFK